MQKFRFFMIKTSPRKFEIFIDNPIKGQPESIPYAFDKAHTYRDAYNLFEYYIRRINTNYFIMVRINFDVVEFIPKEEVFKKLYEGIIG